MGSERQRIVELNDLKMWIGVGNGSEQRLENSLALLLVAMMVLMLGDFVGLVLVLGLVWVWGVVAEWNLAKGSYQMG